MSDKPYTLTDRIRSALRDSDGPMTTAEVCDALSIIVERDTVSALLSQRKKAGEFLISVSGGRAAYAINPGFVRSGAPEPPVAEDAHTAADEDDSVPLAEEMAGQEPSTTTVIDGDVSVLSKQAAPDVEPTRAEHPAVKQGRIRRMADIVKKLNKMATDADLGASAAPTVHCSCGKAVESTSTRQHSGEQQLCDDCALKLAQGLLSRPLPGDAVTDQFGLLDRLDVIAGDIADALYDVLDDGAGKDTTKALVAALRETQHAAHHLFRNRSIAA